MARCQTSDLTGPRRDWAARALACCPLSGPFHSSATFLSRSVFTAHTPERAKPALKVHEHSVILFFAWVGARLWPLLLVLSLDNN